MRSTSRHYSSENGISHASQQGFLIFISQQITKAKAEGKDINNLSKYCRYSSVVVPPEKGKAVMWYNHDIDEHGLLGAPDVRALHGGCRVIRGVKWIANNWITAPEFDSFQKFSVYEKEDEKSPQGMPG